MRKLTATIAAAVMAVTLIAGTATAETDPTPADCAAVGLPWVSDANGTRCYDARAENLALPSTCTGGACTPTGTRPAHEGLGG